MVYSPAVLGMIEPVRYAHIKGQLSVFVWKNIDIIYWHSAISAELLPEMSAIVSKRLTELGGPVSVIHFIRDLPSRPSAADRANINAFTKRHASAFALQAVVLEDAGFAANVIRSVITTLATVGGKRSTFRVMSSGREVIEWLPDGHRRATGVEVDPDALARVLDRTRAQCREST